MEERQSQLLLLAQGLSVDPKLAQFGGKLGGEAVQRINLPQRDCHWLGPGFFLPLSLSNRCGVSAERSRGFRGVD